MFSIVFDYRYSGQEQFAAKQDFRILSMRQLSMADEALGERRWTLREFAEDAGLHVETVKRYARAGRFPHLMRIGNRYLIPDADVQAFYEQARAAGQAAIRRDTAE